MTKLRACDISEGVSRVEQDTVCMFMCARLVHTLVRVRCRELVLTRMVHALTSSGPAVKKYSSCRAA